jgi:hypothetical protein
VNGVASVAELPALLLLASQSPFVYSLRYRYIDSATSCHWSTTLFFNDLLFSNIAEQNSINLHRSIERSSYNESQSLLFFSLLLHVVAYEFQYTSAQWHHFAYTAPTWCV